MLRLFQLQHLVMTNSVVVGLEPLRRPLRLKPLRLDLTDLGKSLRHLNTRIQFSVAVSEMKLSGLLLLLSQLQRPSTSLVQEISAVTWRQPQFLFQSKKSRLRNRCSAMPRWWTTARQLRSSERHYFRNLICRIQELGTEPLQCLRWH